MIYLLRWGTFVVLMLVVIGAVVNYPLLRARFYASLPASPAATVTPARPTVPDVASAAPSPTVAPIRKPLESSPDHTSEEAVPTTSLPTSTVTPLMFGPSTAGMASPIPASDAAYRDLPGNSPESAESYVFVGDALGTRVGMIPGAATSLVDAHPALGAAPAIKIAPQILPIVTTAVAIVPTPTLPPQGPTAKIASKLYLRPDPAAHAPKQVFPGERLFVVGLYTEGKWLLLFNGLWIPADAVDNAPLGLPLVFPTITPPS